MKIFAAGVFALMGGTATYLSVTGAGGEQYLRSTHVASERPYVLSPEQKVAKRLAFFAINGRAYGTSSSGYGSSSSIRGYSGGNRGSSGRVK